MKQKRSKAQFTGPSQRQLRVGELIRRELADYFTRGDHFNPLLSKAMISVSEVRPTTDLKLARVSVYPHMFDNKVGQSEIIHEINEMAQSIRLEITPKLNLKNSPELRFEMDDSFDRFERTEQILSEIKKTDGI